MSRCCESGAKRAIEIIIISSDGMLEAVKNVIVVKLYLLNIFQVDDKLLTFLFEK